MLMLMVGLGDTQINVLRLKNLAGPADHYLPSAHRVLWSECPSEEDWHFKHFPL